MTLPWEQDDFYSKDRIEIIYGREGTISLSMQAFARVKLCIDICSDRTGAPIFVNVEPINIGYAAMKDKGIQLRFLTDITQDNMQYVKKLMKTAEIRHLDDIKGNFGLVDGNWYYASAQSDEKTGIPRQIFANIKDFVEQQQLFFNTLWKKAIPAKQRIKEIEENLKREFIETIQDSEETSSLISKVLSSATEEILIIFSHANTLRQYHRQGILDLLKKKTDDEIVVKMLVGGEKNIDLLNKYQSIEQRYLLKSIQTRLTTIVADRELSLVIEDKEDKEDAVGLATYSNSESTVLSYASIFENLWIQSEIKQQ
jgi:sugar-specific transcriptional regulator TrmB